jgi:hypothetical protein
MKMWSPDVIEELERGRNDAKQLQQRLMKDGLIDGELVMAETGNRNVGGRDDNDRTIMDDTNLGAHDHDDDESGEGDDYGDDWDPDHDVWRDEMVDSVVEEVFGAVSEVGEGDEFDVVNNGKNAGSVEGLDVKERIIYEV